MKTKLSRNAFRRVLSMVMVLAMVFSLIPVTGAAATTPEVLYLQPNDNWKVDNARFAAYFFEGDQNTWADATDSNADGYYEVAVPEGYSNVIFCRMNPGAGENGWNNKWNQTGDLKIPTDGTNLYSIAAGTWDSGGGTWTALYTVTAATAAGGTVTADKTLVPAGETVTLTVTADGGKELESISAEDASGNAVDVTGNTFTMPASDVRVSAVFRDQVVLPRKDTLYLQPNDNWKVDNARFAAYFFEGEQSTWADATDSNGDGYYEVALPEGYTNVIFCRMNPGAGENGWNNKWNQTGDLKIPAGEENCYHVEPGSWDNGNGSWSALYEITVSAEGGTAAADKILATAGETVTLTVTADAGRELESISAEDASGNALEITENTFTMPASPVTVQVLFKEAAYITVYFRNNWKWSDVSLYYWLDNGTNNGWPGEAMTFAENDGTDDIYSFRIPANTAGLIFNGIKNDGSGNRDQSPDVTDFTDGDAYQMDWDNGNKVTKIPYPPVYDITVLAPEGGSLAADKTVAQKGETVTLTVTAEEGKELESISVQDTSGNAVTVTDNTFTMPASPVTVTAVFRDVAAPQTVTVHFHNTAGWAEVAGYVWDSSASNNSWPGTVLAQHSFNAGWYTLTVVNDYAAFKCIFNNNGQGAQTADLSIDHSQAQEFWVDGEAVSADAPAGWQTSAPVEYYLFGYINGANYGCEEDYQNAGIYKFENGKLTATFTADSYIAVKTGDNSGWFMAQSYSQNTTTKLYNTNTGAAEKIFVPGNTELNFTLTEEADGSLTLSYQEAPKPEAEYTVTLHFANTLNWSSVNLYSWLSSGNGGWPGWPGTALTQGADGFYSYTLTYKAQTNAGVNFIFNNGGTQTVDLSIPASEFVDNKAEKWVVLTTQTDGKYNADILDSADSIAISPVVDGNSVTFQLKAPDAASVEVRGDFCGWDAGEGIAMTQNSYGVWSVTVTDVPAGVHEYQFVADGTWTPDPLNTWENNGNSVFLIGDPNLDKNEITVHIHYIREDGSYENWNVWAWNAQLTEQFDFAAQDDHMVATAVLPGRTTQDFSFKVRKSVGTVLWAQEEAQVTLDLSTVVSGTMHVYVTAGKGQTDLKYSADVVKGNKISDIQYDYEANAVTVSTNQPVTDSTAAFELVDTADGSVVPMTFQASTGNAYTFTPDRELPLGDLHRFKIRFREDPNPTYAQTILHDVSCDGAYYTDRFSEAYTYTGKDLGATYSVGSTFFRVWAPTASAVSVKLYATGSDGESGAASLGEHAMTRDVKGTWVVTVEGDLKNVYYTYAVTVGGETVEAIDPYARAAGVNGQRGMVVDLDSTDPAGWSSDGNPNTVSSYTDAVIYELHVRDFSIDASSGISAANRGKYLAFTETGTTVNGLGQVPSGVDYLENLGITHLHLLPVYDYGSVDETKLGTPQFNWGYDPVNYNVPEGSYSSNPYDGNVRIREMKQMVLSLHENGISVIMDVVYNHVYDAGTFSFNQIVPGYFSRVDSNTSGCGNDTASERAMVRKYIVESVLYWAEEYHIDGFRFDLVGLLDVETINQIVEEVHAVRPDIIFYGEGWDMDSTNQYPADLPMAKQGNAYLTPGFAYFSDSMRNLLAGSNGTSTGFVSGAGNGSGLVENFLANPGWTKNPQQVIQYVSCHDNLTLVDKLIKSTGRTGLDADIIRMNNLSAAIYMTSQGVPFIHAGEELLREKLDESGNRVENSYNASDYVNHIRWVNLEKEEYAANMAYYQGLIAFRKAHPALRLRSAEEVKACVVPQETGSSLISFWINGKEVSGETHDSIYLIFNAGTSAASVTLPEGDWDVCVNGLKAGTAVLETVSGTVSIPAVSALILVQETSSQEPTPPAPKSDVALPGSFNGWNQSSFMDYQEGSTTVTTMTLDLPAGTYEFKVKQGNTWYGNGGTIEDTTETTSATGWKMDASAGNCKLQATGGSYTFVFETATGNLIVTHDPTGGDFGDPDEYFLFGYINGADYAMGMETGEYKFDADGKLTVTFTSDSYVCVKNGTGSEKYMTDGWLGSVTSAKLYDVNRHSLEKADKLMIPGGLEVTLTLTVHEDGTAVLSYATGANDVVDETGIQKGLTLHCWNWSFAEIEKQLPLIASQGYTAIQTSPVQALKEATNLPGHSVGGNWWVYYQPVDFTITSSSGNALGTGEELKSLIDAAHSYGIQVIVDVVANHLANQTGNDLSDQIPDKYRDDAFWHDITTNTSDYSNRFDVTQHCMGGLPDLNTGNQTVQDDVLAFLKALVDLGVDGFRFDAAKHIETPEDDASFASDFWPTVIGGAESYAKSQYGKDLYIYGELLDSINGLSVNAYTKYMAVTDNTWGNSLRKDIAADKADLSAGYDRAVDADVLVLWAESHDTYATDNAGESSFRVSEEDIIKTWALVAARKDAMGLYLARPESMDQAIGVASVTGWADATVREINLFHNAFADTAEHVANENGICYVERGTKGVILVQAEQAKTRAGEISVTAYAMEDGTYVDQITGNVFTVADGRISGTIGATGVAVVYNVPAYSVTAEPVQGGKVEADTQEAREGDTVTVTVTADAGKQLDSLTVRTAEGKEVSVTKSGESYSFVMPASDVTVSAAFTAVSYRIIVGVSTGGTVTADPETAKMGDTVTLTVQPDSRKKLDQLSVKDASGNELPVTGSEGTYSFTMPASGVTVTATFASNSASPETGDGLLIVSTVTVMLICLAGIAVLAVLRSREKEYA